MWQLVLDYNDIKKIPVVGDYFTDANNDALKLR